MKVARGICGACRRRRTLVESENAPAKCRPCVQREEILGYKIMRRAMGKFLKLWIPRNILEDCIRVEGRALCPQCRLEYLEHPEIDPTFHMRCDGVIVKT